MPIVVVSPILVAFAGILLFVILYGMQQGTQPWVGALVELLRRTTVFGVHIFNWLAAAIDKAYAFVSDVLGRAAQRVEMPFVAFFAALAAVIDYAAFTTAYVAESALDALHALRHAVIPRLIRYAVLPVTIAVGGAHAIGRTIARELHAAEATLEADFRLALRRAQTALATAEGALERIPSLDVPGAIRSLWRRLSNVEKGLLGAALAGAIVRTLVRHLPWYRCSNVSKAAKGICRTDLDLLDALLAGTLLIASPISLEGFVRECQAIYPTVESSLRSFIRELHSLEV